MRSLDGVARLRPAIRALAAVLASAVLCGAYARGGAAWPLGFIALVPWLRTLDESRTVARALLAAWAMSVAFTAAVFAWFGSAIGAYTHAGAAVGVAVLLVAAPFFQPQFLAFAAVRRVVRGRHGRFVGALAGAAAWVALERLAPKLLGDTLGHGLQAARLVRQAADVGGAAGLTALLVLANEAVAAALARRNDGVGAVLKPLALAVLIPLALAAYGWLAVAGATTPAGKPLRIALVQSNIVDYERLRQEKGAAAVVREVLDTHFAMSRDAVDRQHADAVVWSETVYPTTFANPKSEAGAELDREILQAVDSAGVPFVVGTYDRDATGEYNAAAFLAPHVGLVGFYRKSRLFPLTERVPAWLDGSLLRRWLPWTGSWQPGTGARVFPLSLADGREIPVLPLICLDDMDPGLAVDGARLGAQAIVTMSNDSWFADAPLGAKLHLAAATFRSIETRLPQFRATTNGDSAVIDSTGEVLAEARVGERALLVGELVPREASATLMVTWGDWVGLAATAFLGLLAAAAFRRAWRARHPPQAPAAPVAIALPARVAVLSRTARVAAGALRVLARASLLWMAAALLLGSDALRPNTLAQIRTFAALFVAPEVAAWLLLRAFAAEASIERGMLVVQRGAHRLELALREIVAVDAWQVPVPGDGVSLRMASGARWRYGLMGVDATGFARALAAGGAAIAPTSVPSRAAAYADARLAASRTRLDRPLWKFGVFPLALAIPAFRLHEHIAYGSAFGEYYTYGLAAYLTTFALWWIGWAIALVLFAAVLRAVVEAGTLLAVLLVGGRAGNARLVLERVALATFYLGLPAWLLLRMIGG